MKPKPSASRRPSSRARLSRPRPAPLRVVGIGCSAGGLEACEQFFKHLAPDTGMAFVVVSHLDPDRKGIMPELLQRYTAMKLCQAEDGMRVRPNRVYVIPPNVDLSILHGRLQLLEPSAPRGLRMPIDFFFKHLAQDRQEHGVGIVLSGMGSDGSQGLKAIKEQMGLALAQDPASAKYDGMPHSAIGTGLVDMVAPAAELPAKLAAFVRHDASLPRLAPPEEDRPTSALQKILVLLRARTGVDFSAYKPATIYRRVERRMGVHQLQPLPRYIRYLQENPAETDLLFRELLIGVTGFFRDPAAYEALKAAVPRLIERQTPGAPLRVWAAGCSTGEEAYSLAMVLSECLDAVPRREEIALQIFATDLDKEAVERARQGAFAGSVAGEVSPERLKRFFNRSEHGYTMRKEIRERVVFAPQNILTDPPFTKLDLLCCRNLLIYLNPDWHKKLLVLFHYALNPGGILFLGSAETIGEFGDLFAPLDSRWKIFERKAAPAGLRAMAGMPGPRPAAEQAREPAAAGQTGPAGGDVAEAAQRALLDAYMPPAVVINSEGDIVYVVGRTGRYLEPSSGKVNLNVFAMAREGLRLELRMAVREAAQRQTAVTARNLRVRINGGHQRMHLTVKPLSRTPAAGGLLLVVFEEAGLDARGAKGAKSPRLAIRPGAVAGKLEAELRETRAQLQSTAEQAQAAQEELKAANEEMQSNNEELQSTNEELTTSKEELQSLNEEMTTVNSELQTKLDEVAQVGSDMRNLLNGIDVATVFADNELRIKRFTPQAARIVSVIPTDLGRPLRDLATNLKYDRLVDDAKQVLATLAFKEAEVQTGDGRWYLMRILPYRSAENVIDGVVITFADITKVKDLDASLRESRSALEEARLLAESIISTVREPLLVLDAELRIVSANRSFYRVFGVKPAQTERQLVYEVGERQWDIPDLRRLLREILDSQTEMDDFRVAHDFPGLGHKVMLLNARRVHRPGPHPPLILLAIEDVTDRK